MIEAHVGVERYHAGVHRRPELARTLASVDPHAPPHIRVNMSLGTLPDFAAAFGCPAGSPMAPSERCNVW